MHFFSDLTLTCKIGSEIFPNNNFVHLTTASCCNVLLLAIPVRSSQIRSIVVHVKAKLESNSSISSEKRKNIYIIHYLLLRNIILII